MAADRRTRIGYLALLVLLWAGLGAMSLVLWQWLARARFDLPGTFLEASMLLLFAFLLLLVLRYFALLWFSYLSQLEPPEPEGPMPFVSVLVPAYNEGAVIGGSIRSLLELDYPRYEVVVIDDGSSDETYRRAQRFAGEHGRATVRVLRQRNAGKAMALNSGIAAARGELVVCMDGDSRLDPATLRRAVGHFRHPEVGAVAGNVKVVNRTNLLSKLQALEYTEGLNMVRKAQGFFRLVNIVPGPIGVFRRRALERVGGYDNDTFAEDCDLTLKLLLDGWQIRYEPHAIAYTEAPERLLDLLKQRYRWTRGILQAIAKHRRALWNPRLGPSVCFTLWYMVFEGILWPAMNVFAHVLFAAVAVSYGAALPLVVWWGQLTVLDMAAALYCVAAEEESLRLVPYAIHYRLFFALVIDFAKLFASAEELLRLRMDWGKLERIGRI